MDDVGGYPYFRKSADGDGRVDKVDHEQPAIG